MAVTNYRLARVATVAGVTSLGIFSLLLNPLFVSAAVGTASLLVRRQRASKLRSSCTRVRSAP